MVFPSISESEQPAAADRRMATSSIAKSNHQPLHNFSLTDLKWSPAHHRFRRHPSDSNDSPSITDHPQIRLRDKETSAEAEADAGVALPASSKAWNLRPRKKTAKKPNVAVAEKEIRSPAEGARPRRGGVEVATAAAEEPQPKLSITIPLTKEEIEADIMAMTGLRPSRRPKRRPRNVQKLLDYTFPGLWLNNISVDSYKVVDDNHHPKV